MNSSQLIYILKLLRQEIYDFDTDGATCKSCHCVTHVREYFTHTNNCSAGEAEEALANLAREVLGRE